MAFGFIVFFAREDDDEFIAADTVNRGSGEMLMEEADEVDEGDITIFVAELIVDFLRSLRSIMAMPKTTFWPSRICASIFSTSW